MTRRGFIAGATAMAAGLAMSGVVKSAAAARSTIFSNSNDEEEEMYKEMFLALLQRTSGTWEDSEATSIGAYAFTNWATNYGMTSDLVSVNFPNATSIGNNAFQACLRLTSASLPKVISVGANAFGSCEALPSIHLPLVASIPTRVFFNCFQMRLIDISGATTISPTDAYLFQGIGSRRSDSDVDADGNSYKCLVDVSANTCATILTHARFPWAAPDTTKFQCSDGYIIYDTATSSWKAVTA